MLGERLPPGTAFAPGAELVHITVDTMQLLSKMILQASTVVAAVVDGANTSSIVPESKLCRSSSFLAMPPPKPKVLPSRKLSSSDEMAGEGVAEAGGNGDSHEHHHHHDSYKSKMHGLDILGSAVVPADDEGGLPIVSPDIRAMKSPTVAPCMPRLHLVRGVSSNTSSSRSSCGSVDEQLQQDLSELSPDQCADIVDGIFGEFDDAILREPPAKRLKSS